MNTQVKTTESAAKAVVYPLVDVFENDVEFLLVADLPGVDKQSLELLVEDGELRMKAKSADLEYQRSFTLGDDVDLDAIEAGLEEGELSLRLPKRAEARVRRISVTS